MSAFVFNPFAPVPKNPKSHVRGWALHWAQSLYAVIATKDEDLSQASALYLDHGVNFSGGLNLFGGVDEDVFERLRMLTEFTGRLVSLDMPMPNYAEQLEKRIGQSTCHPGLAGILPRLKERFAASEWVDQASLGRRSVTIGDSHSTAYAPAASAVLRTNGKTLFGALKDDFIQKAIEGQPQASRFSLVFGSIDVRHHLGRQPDPLKAAKDLARSYADKVEYLSGEFMTEIEVGLPVPIEHEERKLPKTGYYEGTPFAGSRELRVQLNSIFAYELAACGVQTFSPPSEWYTMDGEKFAKSYMELGSSVHIAPPHYRRFNWGVL